MFHICSHPNRGDRGRAKLCWRVHLRCAYARLSAQKPAGKTAMRSDKTAKLTLADDERLAESLAYALRHYNGKKRARDADELIARLAAARLVKLIHKSWSGVKD